LPTKCAANSRNLSPRVLSPSYSPRVRVLVLALIVACSSKPGPIASPAKPDDTAVRIRIAYAEARRGGGIAELIELAKHGAKHERMLALRGLGRIGGTTAVDFLRAALADPDKDIVAAAAAAIGLAASLDENVTGVTDALVAHADQPAVVEALGRAGETSAQPTLAKLAATMPEAAIALGRFGRRKIALTGESRTALIAALADPRLRYSATYALAREHVEKPEEPQHAATAAALAKLVDDPDPEVRAQAFAGIAKHKQVAPHAKLIEAKLIDSDWRVAVEAVRALSADDHRTAVITAAVRSGPGRVHVVDEVLRSLVGKQIDPSLKAAVQQAIASWELAETPAVFMTWLFGLRTMNPLEAIKLLDTAPRRHVYLGLVADWCKSKEVPIGDRRAVISKLLADTDVRVRAAALAAWPAMWADGDVTDHENMRDTIAAAIASKDPILSGNALDAAEELYEHEETRAAISHAVLTRVDNEKDIELASSLYAFIGKHAVADGLAACKQGLNGPTTLAKAAAECMKKLGELAPAQPDPRAEKPPFVDVTAVIGKRILWTLKTTKGEIVIELRPDVAPWAVAAIVMLTKRGFYDGLEFHRVVGNFVVQGGDPTESGWGGPGFTLPAEPGSVLDGSGFVAGGVGIADAGRDSGGSQWFIMHARAPHLDGRYTWIGSVISGGNSADALVIGDEVSKASVELLER
jgi:cyclophilin family peptidyl-prolyl cis-trans isomerase/HEAT repeat protein